MRRARPTRGFHGWQQSGGGLEVPASIPNLFAWWRADSGITIGTGVSAWTSKVNGHVVAQATAANQPVVSASTAALGNKPSLTFDGLNDRLVSTEAASVWRFLHDGTGMTVFGAVVPRVAGFLTVWSEQSNAGGTGNWYRIDYTPGTMLESIRNGAANVVFGNPNGAGTVALNLGVGVDVSYAEGAAPEYTIRSANVTRGSGASAVGPDLGDSTGTFAVADFFDGGSPGHFDIAELILYNRNLTVAQKTSVYSYMAGRYGF